MSGSFRTSGASVMTGALFCLCVAMGAWSCQAEDQGTPDWDTDSAALKKRSRESATAAVVHGKSTAKTSANSAGDLRFMTYNVQNWLTMEREVDDQMVVANKPEKERQAVVALIVKHRPDVLGVMEMGDSSDVADLQRRLAAADWKMPHKSHRDLKKSPRNVVLLSRYPIIAESKPEQEEYRLQNVYQRMQRPVMDATIEHAGRKIRFIGVHLKSKREVPNGDQEQMRQQEAHLVRRHVSAILKNDAAARLVVFGDFNDTRNSVAVKQLVGAYRSPDSLWMIPARDSRGHSWTHYWDFQDVYSRFDYITVSPALKPSIDFKDAYVVDDREWNGASDHRPVVMVIKSR